MPYEPMTSGAIRHRIRHWAIQAGIQAKVIGAHAFRHSHATRQVDAGANIKIVSDILGHRSVLRACRAEAATRSGLAGAAMNRIFKSAIAGDLQGFLQFKRSLGYRYARAEFTLREFDRFLIASLPKMLPLDQAALEWLAGKPGRKAVSVSADAAVLRQLFAFLRRSSRHVAEPPWPKLPTESTFVPYFLSEQDILKLLALCERLSRPPFRALLYRVLLLVLYCTGLRFGEALRLRIRDVDTRSAVLFVEMFKGRARWVPFDRSLARELDRYLAARTELAPAEPDTRFFIGGNRTTLPVNTASATLRNLFQLAGMKPAKGRVGPRPYDLRHSFAVQRLSQWYKEGADLHTRLPWLSAYMGHVDIVGTETYLNATPELLDLAASRLRRRYRENQDSSR
jgi:integrase/recombinase XerD